MAAKPPTTIQRRIVVAAGICVLAFTVIGIRLVDLGLLKVHANVHGTAADAAADIVRGDIVDRNGRLLARDLPVYDLYVRPHVFWDKAEAARDLAAATHVSEARLLHAFNGKHNYVLVASQLTPLTRDKVMSLGLPGMEFEPSTKRFYPEGDASQVIGLTQATSDGHGISGIEKGLNARLAAGKRVQLSLDMRIQYALLRSLDATREKYSARAAGGIVLNVNTGEVLAMASQQDPKNKDYNPTRNIMAANDYELGSVFKVLAFALALEDHTITFDTTFPIGSGFRIGKFTIHDAEHMPAVMAAKDILAESSNAGTAQIALRSGPERQKQWLQDLGLLQSIRTEIPERARPLYPSNWGQVETATIGFGHGISVTPLAFVTAAAMIVNGGRRIRPTFLKQDGDRRGEQVLKPETSEKMRELLRYVVTNGTGKNADVPGYDVGGKTGSAEKNDRGRYIAHKLLTSFCAVFPIDNPRYLVFVMLDEPHGETAVMALAGHTAAPLAGDVIAHIAPMLEMPKTAAVPVPGKGNS
jgi:cell division protein FtsI (penicillin-binding protein 3)